MVRSLRCKTVILATDQGFYNRSQPHADLIMMLISYWGTLWYGYWQEGLKFSRTCKGYRRLWFFDKLWSAPLWGVTFACVTLAAFPRSALYWQSYVKLFDVLRLAQSRLCSFSTEMGYHINALAREHNRMTDRGVHHLIPWEVGMLTATSIQTRQTMYMRRSAIVHVQTRLPASDHWPPSICAGRALLHVLFWLLRSGLGLHPALTKIRTINRQARDSGDDILRMDGSLYLLQAIFEYRGAARRYVRVPRCATTDTRALAHNNALLAGAKPLAQAMSQLRSMRASVDQMGIILGAYEFRRDLQKWHGDAHEELPLVEWNFI